MTNLQNLVEEKCKAFDEKFGFYEVYVCADCRHTKEDHYWNGGGRSEASGYDRCRNGDCKCVNENFIVERKKEGNVYLLSFLRESLESVAHATADALRVEERTTEALLESEKEDEKIIKIVEDLCVMVEEGNKNIGETIMEKEKELETMRERKRIMEGVIKSKIRIPMEIWDIIKGDKTT